MAKVQLTVCGQWLRITLMERTRTQRQDPGYAALREGAALVTFPEQTVLRLSGRDPLGMLDAILTRNVPREDNCGVYAALLSPKGRLQADLRVIRSGEDVFVDTGPAGGKAAKDTLGRYAPLSRVKLEDLSGGGERWSILGVYGPASKELVGLPEMTEHESRTVEAGGVELVAVRVAHPVAGYDLLGPEGSLAQARSYLEERGAAAASAEAYETARIAAGIPCFGADLTPENFPGECPVFLQRAVSFDKGCYPGQETVSRMHYRGHPNKTLHRFEVEGSPPEPGASILQNGGEAGRVTSVAPLPVDGRLFALGYLSRRADPEGGLRAGEAALSVSDVPL
jgi:folate-binding protein YgfZ